MFEIKRYGRLLWRVGFGLSADGFFSAMSRFSRAIMDVRAGAGKDKAAQDILAHRMRRSYGGASLRLVNGAFRLPF
jgi:hypothetical protein